MMHFKFVSYCIMRLEVQFAVWFKGHPLSRFQMPLVHMTPHWQSNLDWGCFSSDTTHFRSCLNAADKMLWFPAPMAGWADTGKRIHFCLLFMLPEVISQSSASHQHCSWGSLSLLRLLKAGDFVSWIFTEPKASSNLTETMHAAFY